MDHSRNNESHLIRSYYLQHPLQDLDKIKTVRKRLVVPVISELLLIKISDVFTVPLVSKK